MRNVLVGKTHMARRPRGHGGGSASRRNPSSACASSECGFEPYERDDGLHPDGRGRARRYNDVSPRAGLRRDQPVGALGQFRRGRGRRACRTAGCWCMPTRPRACRKSTPETPYMTRRAMDFITRGRDDGRPWCLHLSYIKPHWPYIAPEPYASMYGADDVMPAIRSERGARRTRIRCSPPTWTCATRATWRATRCARR